MKKLISVLLMATIILSIVPSAYAAQYHGGSSKYRFTNGIANGLFSNNALYSVTMDDGAVFNMSQTAEGAMNQWNIDSEAYFPSNNSSATAFIRAEGYDYGELGLNGWCEMYETTSSANPMNPQGNSAPTSNYQKAWVYGNAHDMWDDGTMTYNERRAVYVHEIGHALGLAHQTSSIASVMRKEEIYIDNSWLVPQTDDINGVNDLY